MSTEIAVRYEQASMDERKDYARVLATADDMLPKGLRGILRDANGNNYQGIVPGKVLLVLETGAMLGIHPMAALQGINVIEGSASIAPSLMQALVRAAGHRLRVDVTGTIAGGDLAATATLVRSDDPEPYVVTWTVWDAVAADLVQRYEQDESGQWVVTARSEKGNKLNWEKYTRQMLKWRSQSEVVRDGAEDVLMGVHYVPEELGSIVDEDGRADPVTVAEFTELENGAIAEIRACEDKADLVPLWNRLHDDEVWTDRVQAAFAAQLSTLPKDSRPPKAGAPGQTGEPDLDSPAPVQLDVVDVAPEDDYEAQASAAHAAYVAEQEAAK